MSMGLNPLKGLEAALEHRPGAGSGLRALDGEKRQLIGLRMLVEFGDQIGQIAVVRTASAQA
jgi:hypothetical protein